MSACTLLANLDGARGGVTGAAVNWRLPCTASDGEACQIVHHLPVWNEVLRKVHLELRELVGTHGGQLLSLSSMADKSYKFRCTGGEQHHAVTLVQWVLKAHSCVTVVNLWNASLGAYQDIMFDALRGNQFIKFLTVGGEKMMKGMGSFQFLPTLRMLREFEVAGLVYSRSTENKVCAAVVLLLETVASLACLRAPLLNWEHASPAGKFLQALRAHSALRELSINESVVMEGNAYSWNKLFAEYVGSAELTTLRVQSYHRGHTDFLPWLLSGLLKNRSITKVSLVDYNVDGQDAKIISEILKTNTSIRAFNIISKNKHLDVDSLADYNAWLTAVLHSNTLEEVTLPIHIWNPEQWGLFFSALERKTSLRRVTVEVNATEYPLVVTVCKALQESGARGKVFFKYEDVQYRQLILEGTQRQELFVALCSDKRSDQMLRTVHHLLLCDRVACVDLRINFSHTDEGLFSELAKYIESTTALKTLHLYSMYSEWLQEPDAKTNRFWMHILQSLSENKSIRRIDFGWWYVDEKLVWDLTDVIKSSQNICKVGFNTPDKRLADALIQGLYVSIEENYKLIEVTLDNLDTTEEKWFTVTSVAGRNSSLVARAGQFITGATRNRCRAEALERVSRYPTLVEEAAELASVSKAEAVAKVREGLEDYEGLHDFMRAVGVIREKVVCHPRDDGCTQLDSLNAHCWCRVRHYLMLEDVRVPVVP